MQPLSAVVFGLTLYTMAIFAEILRAGLAALPRGQAEAALAIGMTRWQTLVSIELLRVIQRNTEYFGADYTVALFAVGAAWYLAINISLSRLAVRLQRGGSRRTAGTIDTRAAADLPAGAVVLDPDAGRGPDAETP